MARTGLLVTAASLAMFPFCANLTWILIVCVGLSLGSGFASPPLNGLASQMIDRSYQGRALGLMQAAGSVGRLVGPLLGGWLLMFDLSLPLSHYARTPLFASAGLLLVAFALALSFRKPPNDRTPPVAAAPAAV